MWAGVPKEAIAANWGMFEPLVEKALQQTLGEMTSRDVYVELLAGNWGLWVVGENSEKWGIVVTRIYEFYQKRYCEIVFLANREGYTLEALQKEFLPVVAEFARERECDALRGVTTRKGFRAAAARGWREIYIEMEYDLWPREAAERASSPAR